MTLFKTAGVAGVFFAQQTCQPYFSDFLVIILSTVTTVQFYWVCLGKKRKSCVQPMYYKWNFNDSVG